MGDRIFDKQLTKSLWIVATFETDKTEKNDFKPWIFPLPE